jgi:hypothetical protein
MILAVQDRACYHKSFKCMESKLQSIKLAPEYQRLVHQFSLSVPSLPLPLVDIVLSYWNISPSMYLRKQSIVAITNDGHCLVIDPWTMKEFRRTPVTPSLLSFLDRDRSSDDPYSQRKSVGFAISPLDNDILVRVDSLNRSIIEDTPQRPGFQPVDLFHIITWIRLSSLTSSMSSSSASTSPIPSPTTLPPSSPLPVAVTERAGSGRHVFDGVRYRLQNHSLDVLLPYSATLPWYSWCGRFMFCFECPTLRSIHGMVFDDPENKIRTRPVAFSDPVHYEPRVHAFDLITCQWLSMEQTNELWENEEAISLQSPYYYYNDPYFLMSTPEWQRQREHDGFIHISRLKLQISDHIPGQERSIASTLAHHRDDGNDREEKYDSATHNIRCMNNQRCVVVYSTNTVDRHFQSDELVYIDVARQRWTRLGVATQMKWDLRNDIIAATLTPL